MKHLTLYTGGHDLRLDDLSTIQNAYSEAIKGLIYAFDSSGSCILSGVVTTTNHISQTVDVTSGYIGFNGEIFSFAATSIPLATIPIGGTTPRLFLKINETLIVPSSPVPYEDGTNKNVHYERVMIIKYFDATQGDINGTNGMYYDSFNHANTFQKGMVIEWEPSYPGEENDVFDSNGLGTGRMAGWAICNGYLGLTSDLRGQFTFMPSVGMKSSAALPANAISGVGIGVSIGNKQQSILLNNLPNVSLPVTDPGHNHGLVITKPSGTSPGTLPMPGASDQIYPQQNTVFTQNKTTGISVNLNGGGQPISTVPPAVSMMKIKRII